LRSAAVAMRFGRLKFTLLLILAVGTFVALAVFGGGGTLWLTNTREAYISYRAGVGVFFALTHWLVSFALLYYLWARRPQGLNLILVLASFCAAAYFLGSKYNILTLVLIGIFYYNFKVKHIPFLVLVWSTPVMLLGLIGLLVAYGSYGEIIQAIVYFRDYFDTTTRMIARFDEFGFYYGRGWLSSFWAYVPRGIYPDKPFEYGQGLIHQVLFPGAAARGHTAGLLRWSLAYLDFGVVGVFAYGLWNGIWQRMTYEYFLRNRHEFFAFVFMMQFAIWPIFTFAPLALLIVLSIGQSIFLRLVWRQRHTASPTP